MISSTKAGTEVLAFGACIYLFIFEMSLISFPTLNQLQGAEV
jgi:hypothetical protein